jgi:hypothetical protein
VLLDDAQKVTAGQLLWYYDGPLTTLYRVEAVTTRHVDVVCVSEHLAPLPNAVQFGEQTARRERWLFNPGYYLSRWKRTEPHRPRASES